MCRPRLCGETSNRENCLAWCVCLLPCWVYCLGRGHVVFSFAKLNYRRGVRMVQAAQTSIALLGFALRELCSALRLDERSGDLTWCTHLLPCWVERLGSESCPALWWKDQSGEPRVGTAQLCVCCSVLLSLALRESSSVLRLGEQSGELARRIHMLPGWG